MLKKEQIPQLFAEENHRRHTMKTDHHTFKQLKKYVSGLRSIAHVKTDSTARPCAKQSSTSSSKTH
jgi:hypothetical protein